MRIKVTHRKFRVHNATSLDIAKGEKLLVELFGVGGRIDWSADNDEVLDIEDDAGPSGKVKAANVGASRITFMSRGIAIGYLYLTVFEDTTDEAVSFKVQSVGPEVPKA